MNQNVPEYCYASLPLTVASWHRFIVVLYLLHGGKYGADTQWRLVLAGLSAWDCSNAKVNCSKANCSRGQEPSKNS